MNTQRNLGSEEKIPFKNIKPEVLFILRSNHPSYDWTKFEKDGYVVCSNNCDLYRDIENFKETSNFPKLVRASGLSEKKYEGVNDLNHYIKFQLKEYPKDWDTLLKIAQFLLLSQSAITDELINWARYFSNLMYDDEKDGKVICLGNIPDLFVGVQTEEISRPPLPQGYSDAFIPSESARALSFPDLVSIKADRAQKILPIIFLFILRSRFGIQPEAYKSKLSRISNFIGIYETAEFRIDFPDDHIVSSLLSNEKGPRMATHPQDRDILAKFAKLRNSIDTQYISRVALGIVVQNMIYYGLSHYQSYIRLLEHLGSGESMNLIGAINRTNRKEEISRFLELINMVNKYPDDNTWYLMRAIDINYYSTWAPRSNPWVTLNLAYFEQKLLPGSSNNPYNSYVSMDPNTFKQLDLPRQSFLDTWVNYWNSIRGSDSSGSLPVPLSKGNNSSGVNKSIDIEKIPEIEEIENMSDDD